MSRNPLVMLFSQFIESKDIFLISTSNLRLLMKFIINSGRKTLNNEFTQSKQPDFTK